MSDPQRHDPASDDRAGSYVWTTPGPSAIPSGRRLHFHSVVRLAALAVAWMVSFAVAVLAAWLMSRCFARP